MRKGREHVSKSAVTMLVAGLIVTGSAVSAVGSSDKLARPQNGLAKIAAADVMKRQIPRDVVLKQLAWRGYKDFSRPELVGRIYRIAATDRRGERIAIAVDAFSGVVVHRRNEATFNGVTWFPPTGGR